MQKLISTGEFAKLLGRSPRTVRYWLAKAHKERTFQVEQTPGGHYRIPKTTALKIIKGNYQPRLTR